MTRAKAVSASRPAPGILTADKSGGGTLFAAVDPAARFVEAMVCESRFSATLHPFTSEAEARTALKRAGAVQP